MSAKWRKFLSYYRPYMKGFIADMCFALVGAATSLIIPLIIGRVKRMKWEVTAHELGKVRK